MVTSQLAAIVIEMSAELGTPESRPRIIVGVPLVRTSELIYFKSEPFIFIGENRLKSIEQDLLINGSRRYDEPLATTAAGIEIERYGSKPDHAEIFLRMMPALREVRG